VYDAGVARLRAEWPAIDGRCRFLFHRIAKRPVEAVLGPLGAAARPEGCVAEMHVTGGADEASLWFVERGGTVDCRYDYDEDAVVRDCVLRGNEISMGEAPPVRAVEALVAMTKRLHYAASKPDRGRWLFVRLDLKRLLRADDARGMRVTLGTAARTALTRSDIAVRGESVGSIFFSVGAP
jgi:hypothetical protein